MKEHARDLSRLSEQVRLGAIIEPNGEVRWPIELAYTAINEIADDGSVVLGLDLWPDEQEATTEVPLSRYPGGATRAKIEPARRHALRRWDVRASCPVALNAAVPG